VQDVFRGDRLRTDAALGEGDVFRHGAREVMTHHQHVEVFVDRVDRERAGRVGARWQDVRQTGDANDVGRVPAAGAFRVVRMDRSCGDGGDRVFDEARFVQRIGVDGDLHVQPIGHAQTAIDGGRRRAPVFVQFEAAGAGADLFDERAGQAAVAFAEETEVDRQAFRGLEHALDVPGAGSASGGVGAGSGTGSAPQKRGESGSDGGLDEWRSAEVKVAVDAAGGGDEVLAGNDLGARTDDKPGIDARLDERITRLADANDAAAADANVPLHDAPVIEDDRVGDDEVERR